MGQRARHPAAHVQEGRRQRHLHAFNPAEACLLASTGSDRSVCLCDLRASVPMRKFMLPMNPNKVAWNPREP